MLNGNRQPLRAMLAQLQRDRLAVADQHNLDSEIAGSQYGPFNDRFGREIAAHRVESDFHGRAGPLIPAPAPSRDRDKRRNGGIRDGAALVRRNWGNSSD